MNSKPHKLNSSLILIALIIILQGVNIPLLTAGDDIKYKVSDIPEELRKGALAVVRNHETVFVRSSLSNATVKVKEVITILNKKAIDLAFFKEQYGKFSKIKKIKVIIYDEFGNVVKKISNDDIHDISAISGYTLYSDARIKYINPEYRTVPFTIEFNYEEVYSGLLGTPGWMIYPGYKVSIEKSSYSITTPVDLQLRNYQRNIEVDPIKTFKNDNITYTWEVENLTVLKKESFSLPFFELAPLIFSAPSDFSIDGYNGSIDSWESFGNWISTLNNERDVLPPETVKVIKSMIIDTASNYETTKMLYEWMQNKTRYVNISIGIGGWQPMLAEDVDKTSYGDCKALSNYMQSILSVANINSYYTLVYAGSAAPKIKSDFPAQQFNHAILCVPIEQDTIWLECTSQQNPFGYIGGFTDDRDVLVITKEGGKLAHTTVYDKNDNYKTTSAIVNFSEYGDGTAEVSIINSGSYYDDLIPLILSTEDERRDMVVDNIDIPSFELKDYSFDETKSIVPFVEEDVNIQIKSYGTKLGKRMIFEVNLLNKHEIQFKRSKTRKNDIIIRNDFRERDTIRYILPDNYIIEGIPPETNITSEFGSYSTQVIAHSNNITYIRNFEINKGTYPKASFSDFKKFSTDIRNADNQKVVLVENDAN